MRKRTLTIMTAVLVAALPCSALGAGYALYEQGGRALGAAGAFTARADDASSVFFNPAGLAGLEGGQIYGGLSLIFVSRSFAGVNPFPGYGVKEQSPDQVFPPVAAYWGQRVGEFGVGFGFYTPYGLTTEWDDPDNFSGRFISTRAEVTPFYFNPAAAWNLHDRVRVGAGLMAVTTSVNLQRHIAQSNPTEVGPRVLDLGTVELDGSSDGLDFGFNAGVQVDVTDQITLGVNYRSGIDVAVEGDADFTFTGGTPLDPQLRPLFPEDQKVSTNLPLPDLLVGAIAFEHGKMAVEADLGWTNWKDFQSLRLEFEDPELNTVREENWEDALFLRAGWEYHHSESMDLRLGVYFDESPQPVQAVSPLLPDGNRWGVSGGLGYKQERWWVDAFGLLLIIPDRSTDGLSQDNYNGTYSSGTGIVGASFGLRY